ncbi:MAG: phosphatase PAP2 family protein, partial [Paracoccaceae bacterium]
PTDTRALARAAAACLAAFALLAAVMALGRTDALDRAAVAAAAEARAAHPWIGYVARDLTALGGRTLLAAFAATLAALLWAEGRRREAVFLALAMAGALSLGSAAKALFGRPRPDAAFACVAETGTSFPSAHATQAAAAWPLFAALLLARRGRGRGVVAVAALLAALTVALSRVVLGVHYPSDVVAGLALGAAWACAALAIAHRLAAARDRPG